MIKNNGSKKIIGDEKKVKKIMKNEKKVKKMIRD